MALDRDKRGEISGELEVAEEEMREINDWKVPMAKDTLLFFVAVVQIVTKLRGMGEGWERDEGDLTEVDGRVGIVAMESMRGGEG